MASTGRDVQNPKSWEDAFSYPIATTRQIEKQLRNDIAANKERLRTLVGSSYRDLLETADRIIHLDERMRESEKLLGDVSLQCNLDLIDKKARHLASLQEETWQQKSNARHLIAQLSLLQKCQTCLSRLFRRGASVLTAAKVLALSRLLHKRIGQENVVPPLLESIRGQLMSQRKRLLRRFDVILVNPKSSLSQLIDAICAFCIVTSSSSTDAIRHFHDLRLDEIRRLSDESEKGLDGALAGFDYYLQSLRTTTKLLGREFSDAVRDLRSKPLLQSSDIQSLEDLDIATTRQFIPPEILNFVPWIKQPNGRGDEAASVLKKWSNVAFEEVCLRLKSTTEVIPNTSELLKFRAQMLQIWLPVSFSSSTHSNSGVFEALRTIFNTRLEHLLHAKAGSLSAIASEVEAALRRGNESSLLSSLPIWDHDFVTSSLGKGAVSYKKQLMDRHLGQSKPTKSILTSLQHWTAAMSTSLENIKQLRTTRWNDFIEEDDDDEDEEEKDRTEQTVRILQKDDPDLYEQEHNSSLRNATHDFQEQIKKAAESLTSTETSKAIFLLRTIRAIHSHLSTFSLQQQQQQDLTILASSVPPLHYLLAKTTTSTLLSHLKPSSLRPSMHKLKAATHLWAGNPSLPTHPSPPIFKLLQHLTTIMADHGPDIWCAEAVTAVKRAIKKSLAERKLLHHSLSGPLSMKRQKRISVNGTRNVKHTDGETEQETETETQLLTTQTIFDFLYLSYALHVPEEDGGDGDDEAEPSVPAQRPDHPHAAALDARAKDYWGRTSALFALLA